MRMQRDQTATSRVASQATMKRAFGDSNISASSGKKLYLNQQLAAARLHNSERPNKGS
jgi:hypothetical protein